MDQHVYHHNVDERPKVNLKVEKNSKGVNWEITVIGAKSPKEAMDLLDEMTDEMKLRYGNPLVAP